MLPRKLDACPSGEICRARRRSFRFGDARLDCKARVRRGISIGESGIGR